MSYQAFAYLYDQLMDEAPYDQWVTFLQRKVSQYGNGGRNLLDVGCGTGSLIVSLSQADFDLTGIDLSEDMLTVARDKLSTNRIEARLFQQDMTELEGLPRFDVIVVFCDSLNYLKDEAQVQQALNKFYDHLTDGGLLLFDVHSLYKMNERFINQVYADSDEEISYIWQCYAGTTLNSVEHELTFFVRDEAGRYSRFEELHEQRTFSIEDYSEWLNQARFQVLDISSDFSDSPPIEQSERIFFVAKKI